MGKKKLEDVADLCGCNAGSFALAYSRKPSYLEHFGLWLNMPRALNRQAWACAVGASIANGTMSPTLEFFKAVTQGEGEALLLKAQFDMAAAGRAQRHG